jgi:N6-adenosine-specific RNA methylase IME4/ParB-like chromosome segregation protein Spo0J
MAANSAIRIDPEFSHLIRHPTAEEYAQLERDIRRDKGARDPLVLWGNILLDGHQRYAICRKHNLPFTTVQKHCTSRNAARFFIIRSHLGRRNLQPYTRIELVLELEPTLVEQGKARQRRGGRTKVPQNSAEARGERETREQLAKLAQVSRDTIAKAKLIAAKGSARLKRQLRSGEISINKAYQTIRQAVERKKRIPVLDALRKQNPKFDTASPVPIILSDPPWQYDKDPYGRTTWAIEAKYPTMPTKDICALPVAKRARQDAVLFLWATSPKLPDAMEVIKAWGFRYVTCMVWVKDKWGLGSYVRQQHELLLIAKRGKGLPVPKGKNRPSSVIQAKRRAHSAKPFVVHRLIEQMYPEYDGQRLEMFARKKRKGWLGWGNQA